MQIIEVIAFTQNNFMLLYLIEYKENILCPCQCNAYLTVYLRQQQN
jgi:hypothetical protein